MLEQELAFAHEVADRAAEIGMGFFRGEFEVRRKADLTPVTEADLEIESMVRASVAERFPGDAVLGEEGGLQGPGEGGRTWIVDPIDGTKNFARGIQVWATLIALRVGDSIELGVVGAPALGERYDATRDGEARCNGASIRASDTASLGEGHVLFGGVGPWLGGPLEAAYLEVMSVAQRTRGFGEFWGHLLVARGAAEAMLEPELRIWDYAALVPVVEGAGGRMSSLDGGALRDGGSVLTTNGLVHREIATRFGPSAGAPEAER